MLRELRQAFLPSSCLRILVVSAFATAAIYAFVEIVLRPGLPAFQFNWLAAFVQGIVQIAIQVGVLACLLLAVPPRITVSCKGVMRQVGQTASWIKREDIRAVHVVLRRANRHFIRIEAAKTTMRIGLSRNVSLVALAEHFEDRTVVHDRRPLPLDERATSSVL